MKPPSHLYDLQVQAKADFKARMETFGGDSKVDTASVAVADK